MKKLKITYPNGKTDEVVLYPNPVKLKGVVLKVDDLYAYLNEKKDDKENTRIKVFYKTKEYYLRKSDPYPVGYKTIVGEGWHPPINGKWQFHHWYDRDWWSGVNTFNTDQSIWYSGKNHWIGGQELYRWAIWRGCMEAILREKLE